MKPLKVGLHLSIETKKAHHAEYVKNKRKQWNTEQKLRNSTQSKCRMVIYREKLKLKKIEAIKSGTKTRQDEKKETERKKKQREAKQKQRKQLSAQKKRRIREKDVQRKRLKKDTEKNNNSDHEDNGSKCRRSSLSIGALKKMVYRTKKKLPRTPERYAKVVIGLTSMVTPKRKAALEKEGISPTAKKNLSGMLTAVKVAVDSLKGRSNKLRESRKKFTRNFSSLTKSPKLQKLFCTATGIKRKYLTEGCWIESVRKRRRDATSYETETQVKEFYASEAISTPVPDKKAVKKDLPQKQVMQFPLKAAWSRWNTENPVRKMSINKFVKLRPKHVLIQKHRKLYQCLCEYCENAKLKVKCLNSLAERKQMPHLKLLHEYDAVDSTLCEKVEGKKFHQLSCVDRKCTSCGIKLLRQKLQPLLQDASNEIIEWLRWEAVKTLNPKTKKEVTKQQQVKKSGPVSEMCDELLQELSFLSVHLFEATWQQQQFSLLHKHLPEKTASLTIDFAENFTCFSQNEIQGAHWAKDSVTIHPCIARYKCPNDHELIEECIDIVSDDLQHDSHAVNVFLKRIMKHLEERGIDLEHAYIISDGCASQYKSKVPLMDVSCSKEDLKVTVERSFYGSRHGKNRCDGEAGVLKSMATRSVKNGLDNINNARELFDVLNKLQIQPNTTNGSCLHRLRTLIFVDSHEITRARPSRDAKTVPGTRNMHSVIGVRRGIIRTRRLSCFCLECLHGRFPACINADYVDDWKTVKMKPIIPSLDVVEEEQAAPRVGPEMEEQAAPRVGPEMEEQAAPRVGPEMEEQAAPRVGPEMEEHQTISPKTSAFDCQPTVDDLEATMIDTSFGDISITSSLLETSFSSFPECYTNGTYLSVRHGSEVYPAVVDNWPWVLFFEKKLKEWTIQEVKYTIISKDVVECLSPPDIVMAGRRVFYKFKEF